MACGAEIVNGQTTQHFARDTWQIFVPACVSRLRIHHPIMRSSLWSVAVGVSALSSIVLGEAPHGPHITGRAFADTHLAPRAHSEHSGLLGLFPHLKEHSKLAIRQAVADNTTVSGGSGEYEYGLPEKCTE